MKRAKASTRHRSLGVIRALQLAQRLMERRWTVLQLSQYFGVHERTIWRDLDILRAADLPLRQTSKPGFTSEFWIGEDE